MIFAENDVALMGCTVLGSATIGYRSYANDSVIRAPVTIGRYCSIGRRCTIGAINHPIDWLTTHPTIYGNKNLTDPDLLARAPPRGLTSIGNDVWIGDNAVIIEGVSVGDGAIVGAGAVVTKDVAPYTIVGGVAAKLLRRRFPEGVTARLLEFEWWRYEQSLLQGAPLDDIFATIELISVRIAAGHPMLPPHHKMTDRTSLITPSPKNKQKKRAIIGKFKRLLSGSNLK